MMRGFCFGPCTLFAGIDKYIKQLKWPQFSTIETYYETIFQSMRDNDINPLRNNGRIDNSNPSIQPCLRMTEINHATKKVINSDRPASPF